MYEWGQRHIEMSAIRQEMNLAELVLFPELLLHLEVTDGSTLQIAVFFNRGMVLYAH